MDKIKLMINNQADCYIPIAGSREYILKISQRKPVTQNTQVLTLAEMAKKIEELITTVNILIENK